MRRKTKSYLINKQKSVHTHVWNALKFSLLLKDFVRLLHEVFDYYVIIAWFKYKLCLIKFLD